MENNYEIDCDNASIREMCIKLKELHPEKTNEEFAEIMQVKRFPAANHSLGHLQNLCIALGHKCSILIETK